MVRPDSGYGRMQRSPLRYPLVLRTAADTTRRVALRTYFSGVFADFPPIFDESRPLLVYADHRCRWDAALALQLGRSARRPTRILVHEDVIRARPWLETIGLVPLSPDDPFEASRTFAEQASWLLSSSKNVLWTYAYGQHLRPRCPADLPAGNAALLRVTANANRAVAHYHYEFLRTGRPWAWIRGKQFNPPDHMSDVLPALSGALERGHLQLAQTLATGGGEFMRIAGGADVVTVDGQPLKLRHLLRGGPRNAISARISDEDLKDLRRRKGAEVARLIERWGGQRT